MQTWFALLIFIATCPPLAIAQTLVGPPRPIFPDDPKGYKLPRGVPRMVDTNGTVVFMDVGFTTKQYQQAALKLVLQEANRVAKEMDLPEELPITESNLTEAIITPFAFNYMNGTIGNVTTTNYVYYISCGNRFNKLDVANYDNVCLSLTKTPLPIARMDTNAAYKLATNWLAVASMDVDGLNRDCDVHVAVSPNWNKVATLGQKPARHFVPIYYIWWTSEDSNAGDFGTEAAVELFAPENRLLQMTVFDPKYIRRKPLVFKDLDSLFPGIAPVVVVTNFVDLKDLKMNRISVSESVATRDDTSMQIRMKPWQ